MLPPHDDRTSSYSVLPVDLIPLSCYNPCMENSNVILRICPICGTEYKADLGRLKYGRQTTCSRVCSYELRTRERENKARYECASCGKEVWRTPAQAAKAKHGIFCSRKCHFAGRSTGATKRIVTKPYEYTSAGKAAMIAAASAPKGKRVFHIVNCVNCGKEFDDPRDGRKRKNGLIFCSLDCCNAYRKGENNPAWRGGYPGYYGPDWRALRRAARIRDDYTCRRCRKDMHKPHRAPDVHHIKPVSSFEVPNDANTIDNVVCLCHNCHMTVEWRGIDFLV